MSALAWLYLSDSEGIPPPALSIIGSEDLDHAFVLINASAAQLLPTVYQDVFEGSPFGAARSDAEIMSCLNATCARIATRLASVDGSAVVCDPWFKESYVFTVANVMRRFVARRIASYDPKTRRFRDDPEL